MVLYRVSELALVSSLIVPIRIIWCPIWDEICFLSAICVVNRLVAFVFGVPLVGVIINICPTSLVVRIILIGPVVELRFGMRFS